MPLKIRVPITTAELDKVRDLIRAFSIWHRQRNSEDIQLVDQYFDAAEFETELASLPGKYCPPHGQLLLATLDGAAAGCVALRRIDSISCEMKRMFVHTHLQGRGIGRALAKAIIAQAGLMGYGIPRLDTPSSLTMSCHRSFVAGSYSWNWNSPGLMADNAPG